jgi:hypothetical protein
MRQALTARLTPLLLVAVAVAVMMLAACGGHGSY